MQITRGPAFLLAVTAMGCYVIRNWARHQHYKHRDPPWIKVHRSLLNDPEYHELNDSARALLLELWILGPDKDGHVSDDSNVLAFRLRRASNMLAEPLQSLVEHGFITHLLACCKHDASQSTEESREEQRDGVIPQTTTENSKPHQAPTARDEIRLLARKTDPRL